VLKPDKLGSTEPGKWADPVGLDKYYMTNSTEQIHAIQPQMTAFNGKMIFLRPASAQ
jgi:predicted amidohydrolase YtcJ